MKLFKLALLLVIVSTDLIGCGGSVESGGSTSVDTTPPVFINGDPDGTVTQACSVTAEFDEPIAASSITDQSFKIVEDATSTQLTSANGDGTWQIHPDSNTMALFSPTVTITNSQYTVTVTTDITDIAGNHLAVNHTWSFTPTLPCAPAI